MAPRPPRRTGQAAKPRSLPAVVRAQRNKGLSPEDAKPGGSQGAKKNPFASWHLCEKKKKLPEMLRDM